MNAHLSIRNQFCHNKYCHYFQKLLAGNVVVHGKIRFQCKYCKKTWVGHKGAFYFGLRCDAKKIEHAQVAIQSGFSVRSAAQKTGVSPSTIQRWKARFKKQG